MYLAQSSMNFPMFSNDTILDAANSHMSPRSDSKYSFEVSRRDIMADVSHLLKSGTVPGSALREREEAFGGGKNER